MGFSPLEGLVMGHRSGDIDPIVAQYLCDVKGMSLGDVINMLNKESGLKGLSGGQSGDSRDVEDSLARGCPKAKLAVDTFCYRQGLYLQEGVREIIICDTFSQVGQIYWSLCDRASKWPSRCHCLLGGYG